MLLKFFTSPGFMEERGGKDISAKVHLKACGSLQSQLEEESVVWWDQNQLFKLSH